MTTAQEIAKLNPAQRDALRRIVGGGAIEALTVRQSGHKTVVNVTMFGTAQKVTIGPRGKLLGREVH